MTRTLILAALCFLGLGSEALATETTLPRLKVVGNHLSLPNGDPVTLRGVSLCSLEWHKPLKQIEQVTKSPLKWNVNVLRLPVQVVEWRRDGAENYVKNYLDPAVQLCKKNDVYCVIDWHEIAHWNDKKVHTELEEFWKIVAPRYAADKNILYEIFNEPTEPSARNKENWLAWRDLMQGWVDMIRRDAPNTVLLVGSPHWSQMPSFAVDDPVAGKNLVYTMHLYPNWKHVQWDELFGEAAAHIPIFISEWGWSNSKDAWWGIKGDRESYGNAFKAYVDARPNVSWTAWSYDPLCGPAMLGVDKDMGDFVKAWLDEIKY